MRSFPKTNDGQTSNSGTNDGMASQQAAPLVGSFVKLRGPTKFYRGDPDVMDSVNLLNTDKKMCYNLFGVENPNLERKVYYFKTLAAIKFLRDPSREIDVIQYEYNGGAVCFLVGEQGIKEELISKGFVFLHECFLGSPIKAFIDLDFPPSDVSESDFHIMILRAEKWIARFQHQVNSALEGIMISVKRAEKAAKPRKSNSNKPRRGLGPKGVEDERKKLKHEWSVQTAHRLPGKGGTSKISFHVINNSSYNGKPLLFENIVHMNRFIRDAQRALDVPVGFTVDNTFTYKGKTLRCFGAAKRSEPERLFVDSNNLKKPFSFGCVQPDSLDMEHYVISTVQPSTLFDDLYPESDFLAGCGNHKNGSGGSGGATTKASGYSCTITIPLSPENRRPCNELIECVARYLATVKTYKHVLDAIDGKPRFSAEGKNSKFPYSVYNLKTRQDRSCFDICIWTQPRKSCLLGPRQHKEGIGNTSLQLRVRRGVVPGDFVIELKCQGGTSDGHSIRELEVGHLGGGLLSLRSDMMTAAEVFMRAVENKPDEEKEPDQCEDE